MDTHKISRSMRQVTVLPLDKDNWPSALCPTLRELWVLGALLKNFRVPVWCLRPEGWQGCSGRTRASGDLCFSLTLYPFCCSEEVWALCLWVLWLSSGSSRVSWQRFVPAGQCSISFIGSCETGCRNGAELGLVRGAEWEWGWDSGSLGVHHWPSGLELCELPPAMVLPLSHGTWGQASFSLCDPTAGPQRGHRVPSTGSVLRVPVGPSNLVLLPWMDVAMPHLSESILSRAGQGMELPWINQFLSDAVTRIK